MNSVGRLIDNGWPPMLEAHLHSAQACAKDAGTVQSFEDRMKHRPDDGEPSGNLVDYIRHIDDLAILISADDKQYAAERRWVAIELRKAGRVSSKPLSSTTIAWRRMKFRFGTAKTPSKRSKRNIRSQTRYQIRWPARPNQIA
ncbi:hypothetical protein B5P46_26525 [Rhizobium leguminosarum]|uniref:Uncharacterized protein n=1 Tax=Rhizobium leguminosarum TaxID=384 RepID=A0A4Q1TN84_RHILE|nr:hypothetical protein B5P46_26525 [Rhizobium leguminosarum]